MARQAGGTAKLPDLIARAQAAGQEALVTGSGADPRALVASLGRHDRRTRGHSERVRIFTDLLADELRLSQHDRDRCAGPLCFTTSAS